jgi:H+-translocating NAD(P) transhydrogenase subunit alpha
MATPEQALKQAGDAARLAREAAGAAEVYVEQASQALAAAAHATTGGAVDPTVFRLAIFVLAICVGYYVVWSVTPALHTPLMSVTNAISGIIVVGALLQIGHDDAVVTVLAFVAILVASINVFGGFAVTRRMLGMFTR